MSVIHIASPSSGWSVLTIVLVLSLSLEFSECGSPPKQKLKIGYMSIAECAQVYVAKDMGFFDTQGLEVELVSLAGGAQILNALNSGSVDIGFSNVVSLILQTSEGSKFYSVFGGTYETREYQNHALFISAARWRGSVPASLREATIAINTSKNIEELMLWKYLKSIGVKWSETKKVEVPFPRMLPLLETGSVDAVSIVEPFITIAKNDTSRLRWLGNQYLSTTSNTLVATYVTSRSVIDTSPDRIRKFIAAMSDATDFIHSHESQSREIIGRYTKIQQELLSKMGLSEFRKNIDGADLDSVIKDMKEVGFISPDSAISPDKMIMSIK